jgi:hypothetical protein
MGICRVHQGLLCGELFAQGGELVPIILLDRGLGGMGLSVGSVLHPTRRFQVLLQRLDLGFVAGFDVGLLPRHVPFVEASERELVPLLRQRVACRQCAGSPGGALLRPRLRIGDLRARLYDECVLRRRWTGARQCRRLVANHRLDAFAQPRDRAHAWDGVDTLGAVRLKQLAKLGPQVIHVLHAFSHVPKRWDHQRLDLARKRTQRRRPSHHDWQEHFAHRDRGGLHGTVDAFELRPRLRQHALIGLLGDVAGQFLVVQRLDGVREVFMGTAREQQRGRAATQVGDDLQPPPGLLLGREAQFVHRGLGVRNDADIALLRHDRRGEFVHEVHTGGLA